ncbi:MAG TPA: phosphopantetheine-binding protein [Polyangium sp.]|jgi:acyl carrier protein|nr:phosphopantetheine-binding protein [Polyangium sp.]
MNEKRDLLELFKDIALRVDKRALPHVTRTSKISDLGIDSLAIMQIVGELETELEIMIPDEDLVEIVTVGDLCDKVASRLDKKA